ncbi:Sterol 3-beta-glucosyltransferase UGT80A2 [Sesamum angolense]|uniref:Sterol 3-beta-glucosyltransferase UGT80A2 n=1 Tax=Sesamum angolense TaxID=2727404 RepID=A0AAE1XAH5_9LAMI|nr:Sterol 3-beta-glucosyltransferase UGT80A2 [Sesamum angolense]
MGLRKMAARWRLGAEGEGEDGFGAKEEEGREGRWHSQWRRQIFVEFRREYPSSSRYFRRRPLPVDSSGAAGARADASASASVPLSNGGGSSSKSSELLLLKDDGTVEFEVPSDVEPHNLRVGSENVYNEVDEDPHDATELQYIPPMQIVMLIVECGDVQPFVAIGKRLQDYGHRVRLATHSNFKEFVLTSGLNSIPLVGIRKFLLDSISDDLM